VGLIKFCCSLCRTVR